MRRSILSAYQPVRSHWWILLILLVACAPEGPGVEPTQNEPIETWMTDDPAEWPQIALINQIEYTDARHPSAGCGFLIDTGEEILAATAKHVLTYFKSDPMDTVSFGGTLKAWRMFPRNSPEDIVVIDRLMNEDPQELLQPIPSSRDWLLFTIREATHFVQPLRLRATPLEAGETVYLIGWRYPDEGPQHVHRGRFVRVDKGTLLVSIDALTGNTVPGLSGSPVIDARGYVIGLMSTKSGDFQRLAPVAYAREVIEAWRPGG